MFLFTGGFLNIVLAMLNMLPIPPLDGSSVLSGMSFRAYQFFQRPQSQMLGMFLILVIFMTGCGGFVYGEILAFAARFVNAGGALFESSSRQGHP